MNSPKIKINPQRLDYLLELFYLKKNDVLDKINDRSKNKILLREENVFNEEIKLSVLKQIDKIFQQGLSYYTNPTNIERDENSSIFFRKKIFRTTPTLGDHLRVNAIEKDSHYLNALVKLSSYPLNPTSIDNYTPNEKPEKVAQEIRDKFYPQKNTDNDRSFLKALINKLSEQNIIIFEFIEPWNLKEKSDFDGCFIAPNVIAIKRQQNSLKREIFTLAHELGHYLLKEEYLDKTVVNQISEDKIEKWCNAFAFSFLVGPEKEKQLQRISNFSLENNEIKRISKEQHISRLALSTKLYIDEVISQEQYTNCKKYLEVEYKKIKDRKDKEKAKQKAHGIKRGGAIPKPIRSSLEEDIYRNAFLSGVIDEYEVLKHFRLKDFDKLIYG